MHRIKGLNAFGSEQKRNVWENLISLVIFLAGNSYKEMLETVGSWCFPTGCESKRLKKKKDRHATYPSAHVGVGM